MSDDQRGRKVWRDNARSEFFHAPADVTPREFRKALFRYADEHGIDLHPPNANGYTTFSTRTNDALWAAQKAVAAAWKAKEHV